VKKKEIMISTAHHQLKRFFINFTKLIEISDITIQLIAKLNVSIYDAELHNLWGKYGGSRIQ
jgi:hypothetical protein